MLGASNARMNELEAENSRLRAELLAQTQRADALLTMNAKLRRENTTLVCQVSQMARGSVPPALTLNEMATNRITGVGALQRLCWN